MIALCATEKHNLRHIDSGCSKHMIGEPKKFIGPRKYNKGKVTLEDNMSSKIIGKGTATINNKIKDENVLLVEDLKPNLLSVSETCDQGLIYFFYSENVK